VAPPGNQAANGENKPQPKYLKKPVYSTKLLYVECESVAPCSTDEAHEWSALLQHELPEALAGIRTLLNLKSIAIPLFVVLQPAVSRAIHAPARFAG